MAHWAHGPGQKKEWKNVEKIIKNKIQEVKVVLGGELTKSLKIKGLKVSKAAREEITSKGGEIN